MTVYRSSLDYDAKQVVLHPNFKTQRTHKILFVNLVEKKSLLVFDFIVAPQMTNLTIESNRKNTTVLLNSSLILLCVTNSNPPALYHLYFNESYIGNSSSGEFNDTAKGDGVYTCVPINRISTGYNDTLNIIAVGELPCIFYTAVVKVSHGG